MNITIRPSWTEPPPAISEFSYDLFKNFFREIELPPLAKINFGIAYKEAERTHVHRVGASLALITLFVASVALPLLLAGTKALVLLANPWVAAAAVAILAATAFTCYYLIRNAVDEWSLASRLKQEDLAFGRLIVKNGKPLEKYLWNLIKMGEKYGTNSRAGPTTLALMRQAYEELAAVKRHYRPLFAREKLANSA